MNILSRRHFLQLSSLTGAGLLAAGPAAAIEPFKRVGKPRLQLSLAAYSFRNYFKDSTHKQEPGTNPGNTRIDLFDFVNFCADHGCDGTELTAYYFPKDVGHDYLIRLRRQCFLRGVAVSGTSVGNNFALPPGEKRDKEIADVKLWIDRAAVLDAPHIRLFAGAAPKGTDEAEARRMCIAAIEECCDYAGSKGIFLGLENHGGIVAEADGMLEILHAVKSRWLGVNLDTGNFHTEDPYGDLEKIAPYAVNVQIKVEIRRKNDKENSPSDFPRLVKILRDANYQGFVALEYEAKPDPWEAVPPYLEQLKKMFAA